MCQQRCRTHGQQDPAWAGCTYACGPMVRQMENWATHAENSLVCCFPALAANCLASWGAGRQEGVGALGGILGLRIPWGWGQGPTHPRRRMHLPRFLSAPKIVAGAASSLQSLRASRRLPLLQPGNSGYRRRQDDEGAPVGRGQRSRKWAAIQGLEPAWSRTPEPVRCLPSICRRSSLTAGTTCWAVWPACSPSSC